jgi:hypothetical protein
MEQMKALCTNPWCKAHFYYTEKDMIVIEPDIRKSKIDSILDESKIEKIPPRVCFKCKSFDSELSDGVSWTDKEYEGKRFDGTPHQLKYKVTNYKL